MVKWTASKVIDCTLLLMIGTAIDEKDVEKPISAPHADSVSAVDAHTNPIPYCKQDLVCIMNRVPIGFHSIARKCLVFMSFVFMFGVDDSTVIWANNTLLSILGYEANEYIGQSLLKVITYASYLHRMTLC